MSTTAVSAHAQDAEKATSPAPAQVGLALIILKSKPDQLSLEEYFAKLREHISSGRRPSSEHEHLDSITFWKKAYEESEAAQAKLLDRIYELEQGHALDQHKYDLFDLPQDPEVPVLEGLGKRKRGSEPAAKANSQSKRLSVSRNTAHVADVDPHTLLPVSKAITARDSDASIALLRRFFELSTALKAKKIDPSKLLVPLSGLCQCATEHLTNIIRDATAWSLQATKSDAELQKLYKGLSALGSVTRKVHEIILRALTKLGRITADKKCWQRSLYYAVGLFEASLSELDAMAILQAKLVLGHSARKVTRAHSKSNMTMDLALSSDLCKRACQLLSGNVMHVLSAIDLDAPCHLDLLEGCMCALLDHISSSLSRAIFTDPDETQGAALFRGVKPPRGLCDNADLQTDTVIQAVQIEAPYLVQILERTMHMIDSHQARISSGSAPMFSLSKDGTVTKSAFVQKIHNKLQNTLLQGVFGDEAGAFADALRRPSKPDVDLAEDVPASPEEGTSEWFVREVWLLVGWSILSSTATST